jgi:phosphatidylinositol alpha-1,6-mannosyltransferase
MNKYLIVSSEFPPGPGGIGQHAYSMAKALLKYGDVHVLANQDYTTFEERKKFNKEHSDIFTIEKFNKGAIKGSKPLLNVFQTYRAIKKINPDLVIVTGRFPLIIGGILKKLGSKVKIFGIAHGSEITKEGGKLAKITTKSSAVLDQIYAVSTYTKNELLKSVDIPIKVLPNGLDDEYLEQSRITNDRFDWKGYPKLLTVGNTTPRKGQHNVIKSLPQLLEVYPDLHYHIVGLETGRKNLEELASNLGVQKHITFHGRIPTKGELLKAYNTSDIFIMLSENQSNGDIEGFGIALLEANALGKPAIGSVNCGIEDAISIESGRLVNPHDSNEILNGVTELLNGVSLDERSRLWAEKHNWSDLIKELVHE